MSLINEALKEAQREAHERSGRQTRSDVADTFFPYPEKAKSAKGRRLSTQSIAIAATSLVFLLIIGAAIFFSREKSNAGTAATLTPLHQSVLVAKSGVTPPAAVTPVGVAAPIADQRRPTPAASAPADVVPLAAPVRVASGTTRALPPSTVEPPSHTQPIVAAAAPVDVPSKITQPPPKSASVGVVIEGAAAHPGDSLFKLAYDEQSRGNFDRAKELYERLIAQAHASADAFNNLGVLLLQTGDQIGATEMFKQALTRDDRSVNAWVNLGDSYNKVGHHAEAMSAFARAGQLDESSAAVKVRLAAEYEAIGDTLSARHQYDRALQLAPSDPSVHYTFGKFLQAQHDVGGAMREYQLFVDLAPGKYSTENIDMIRKYIVALGRQAR